MLLAHRSQVLNDAVDGYFKVFPEERRKLHDLKESKNLANKGYISDQGKSGAVYSLTDLGVFYAVGKSKEKGNN